ncbi:undecaprenyl-phosphate glucose phosphotransferase [Burkholderia vietnamiensis]|jgi:Undecaprenyl-phosphate glucose phosphotransferase|uniref:undecaprenyl-phosphate glucose phosphotransferase n=1 Tax=Burkholderia vietnamiensis TaxID=60552 RepID=UPI0007520EFC|nr:undecaprenyl-phosphate glucose phosphotransferase [Burkholderia vietnamiensis]KVE56212.1 undecaprenyl-phosphate glucose phosphotransferase [Burkholderia vietnamiensis]KVE75553.1 undecaprenyl-phosphate glucose phosphotransferase [Burkholderia vietnamiensis]KVE88721.1 undecaprenyl-phosphate glucose phosphotransferase [Burkholderia vietnamiensis]MBR7919366.1 undecaprenyl-phosphate glucose phosphotransferase [Burkholderia vietnamiensis]MDN7927608.1 undecaprenyl-phosphate glucose phosphotransfer
MFGLQGMMARLVDIAVIVAGSLLASQFRYQTVSESHFDSALVTFSIAFALVLFPAFGVYESWRGRSMLRLSGKISLAWFAVQACGIVLMFSLHRSDVISRLWFVYWTAMTGSALIASRIGTHLFLRSVRHAGINLRRVAVVGHAQHCQQVIRNIEESPASGFRPAAVFDLQPVVAGASPRVPVFTELDEFAKFVRETGVQEIWLALPLSEEATILRFVNAFGDDLVNIRFIPDVRSVALFDGEMVDLMGAPAINLVASPLPRNAMWKKELFDRLFAAVALIGLLPVMVVIAIAVKLSSRGPVFFKQYRKGADGREFQILKFRTMRVHVEQAGVVTQATKTDSRITRVGRFLRKTSLDELPQFLNVLRGEMSVVGPRPHAIEHDRLYQKVVDGYIHRYRIKPGITGWAQVNGYRGETDRLEKMQKRVEYDLYYLRNWSFALDMRIVLATVAKGLVNANAY